MNTETLWWARMPQNSVAGCRRNELGTKRVNSHRVKFNKQWGPSTFVGSLRMGLLPRLGWGDMLAELAAYKEQHGHCNVPTLTTKLGQWISTQRHGKMDLPVVAMCS